MSELSDAILLPGYTRRYVSEAGGWVDVHETHGKQEVRQNLPIAVFLADRSERVRLLPVSRIPGAKCADATRNEVEWEFKTLESQTANAVDTALRNASKQADRILLALPSGCDTQLLEQAVFNRTRRALNIVEVAVLLHGELFSFTRTEISSNYFRGKMT